MTVEHRFGGQTFMKEQMKKVEYLAKLREKHGTNILFKLMEINDETIDFVRNTGVDIVVAELI